MSEYLDKVHEHQRAMRVASGNLDFLAEAFSVTGNKQMAEELWRISGWISESTKELGIAVTEELNRSVRQAQEGSANLVAAVFAGIDLTKSSAEEILDLTKKDLSS